MSLRRLYVDIDGGITETIPRVAPIVDVEDLTLLFRRRTGDDTLTNIANQSHRRLRRLALSLHSGSFMIVTLNVE